MSAAMASYGNSCDSRCSRRNGSQSRKLTASDRSSAEADSDDNQEAEKRSRGRACCFCWCCCFSCSCLSVKANRQEDASRPSGNSQPARDFSVCDFDSISRDEAKEWGESFEKLMQSANGRKVFREFLKSEYSEENILFWLACEELKQEVTPEGIEEKARIIYEDYISILSPKEVSLDARVREVINKNMVEPTAHTFDDAQVQIFTLMHRDSYPRFLNSQYYKGLVSEDKDAS